MNNIRTVSIKCSICDCEVPRLEISYDACNQGYYVKVWCHGDTDICYLDSSFLIDAQGPIFKGEAFTTKRLTTKGEENGSVC